VCRPLPLASIPRAAWDRLFKRTTAASPFARWTVHRAWWDAYGSTAHEQYLVCIDADGESQADLTQDGREIRAIVPLMHRHESEPDDERTATVLRRRTERGTHVRPDAKAVFFGASYHADYATILADSADLPSVAVAVAETLAGPPDTLHGEQPWDAVDLRRIRHDDPLLPVLHEAFTTRAPAKGWQVIREQEDVCPVVSLATDDWDVYLGTLGKKARHEIRRKLRRAEAAGPLSLRVVAPTSVDVDAFITLHQARFGVTGLFPDTAGGERSRQFVHRLADLERSEAEGGALQLAEVRVGGRLIFAALAFDDGETTYLYNAGMDPEAAELSPGVTGTATYLRDRIERGRRRFDFLRGDEAYKYDWGATDEPIERLLVLSEPLP
jgi:CelD/BcsL family acetyltransferase involved in cellulose biosynthesis